MGTHRGDRPDRQPRTQGGLIVIRGEEGSSDVPADGSEEPELDEEIVVIEAKDEDEELVPSPDRSADDDWMSGEFDIT